MPLGIGTTNTTTLFALNALRVNQLQSQTLAAQLSSGNRLPFAGIDPSALAISQGFRSMISGTDQAIYNAQDNISLTQTADAALSSQTEILGRMRDLAVGAANDATLTQQDRNIMNNEFQAYNAELTRQGQATTYNTKPLTTDVAGQQFGTQATQVTAENNPAASNIPVTINPSTAATLGTNALDLTTGANAQTALTQIDTALAQVSNQRAALGVNQNQFTYATNELNTERINLTGSYSTLADMNMAAGLSEQARLSLLQNTGIAMLSATNANAYGVLKLLGA